VIYAAQHPLGLYHVEDQGANVHAVYFTARRAKKPKLFATTSSMPAAFRKISGHEDKQFRELDAWLVEHGYGT